MRILPVMDLKAGTVVHAVAGQREQYQPIHSRLAGDAGPASIARAYCELGFREVYVADLDALAGHPVNHHSLQQIAECGLRLTLDAACTTVERIEALQQLLPPPALSQLVIALESIEEPARLPDLLAAVGCDRAVFSIDLFDGCLMTRVPQWRGSSAVDVARRAVTVGFRSLLFLDIASVGTETGATQAARCGELRAAMPNVTLLTGGGVRDRHDLQMLENAGCNAALVCTALHNGRLTAEELAPFT